MFWELNKTFVKINVAEVVVSQSVEVEHEGLGRFQQLLALVDLDFDALEGVLRTVVGEDFEVFELLNEFFFVHI